MSYRDVEKLTHRWSLEISAFTMRFDPNTPTSLLQHDVTFELGVALLQSRIQSTNHGRADIHPCIDGTNTL